MKNFSLFQLIVLVVAIAFIVIGIAVFALFGGALGGKSTVGAVVIWGTYDGQTMQNAITDLRVADKSFENVTYVQKDAATYESDIVNAIAGNSAPDLFLLPQTDISQFANKVQVIPYSAMSQSAFNTSFIDEGQLYLTPQGALALPVFIDPLVMYWNNDLFSSAGIASPPALWSDFLAEAPSLTSFDTGHNIVHSAAALGLWSNIPHAKEILSALIMQAGDPIVTVQNGVAAPVLGANAAQSVIKPAESALRFYTDFADPSKTVYAWNRSLPAAGDAFAAGESAAYFGYASENGAIAARNPNLHFSVALLPQVQGGNAALTYGAMEGLAIPHGAKNPTGALAIAEKLTASSAESSLAAAFNLPPVRRDLIQNVSNDAVKQVFMQSALIAHGWLDPDPSATDGIFQTMIESVVSGASTPADAISAASQSLTRLFQPATP